MRSTRWQVTSNTQKSLALAVGSFLLGVLFIWLTRGSKVGDNNAAAAMWLGVLLAALGLAAFLFLEDVVVTVDGPRGCVVIDRRTRWGTSRTLLPFDGVESVRLVKLGASSDGTPSYWLQIYPKRGKPFSTGRWSTDEAEIGRLAQQMADDIGCACRTGTPVGPASGAHLIAAALGAAALYALWYRLAVGPWCPAMWFGTAPPVIVLAAFAALLGLLRRVWR